MPARPLGAVVVARMNQGFHPDLFSAPWMKRIGIAIRSRCGR
ncbi:MULTISPECIES: hypothetical protein [Sorangium]